MYACYVWDLGGIRSYVLLCGILEVYVRMQYYIWEVYECMQYGIWEVYTHEILYWIWDVRMLYMGQVRYTQYVCTYYVGYWRYTYTCNTIYGRYTYVCITMWVYERMQYGIWDVYIRMKYYIRYGMYVYACYIWNTGGILRMYYYVGYGRYTYACITIYGIWEVYVRMYYFVGYGRYTCACNMGGIYYIYA